MAGVYLKEPVRRMETSIGAGTNFEYAATTCQGWRNTQEDAHVIKANFDNKGAHLFGVFDGHNGIEVASYVSKYMEEYIRLNRRYQSGQIKLGLREAFILLDNSILTMEGVAELRAIRKQKHPELNVPHFNPGVHSGCTAVVCILKNNLFYVANIGDTRCVLARNGKALPLSIDHKPEDPEETARIERAGGRVDRGRIDGKINVSRSFGDHMFKLNLKLDVREQMIIADPTITTEQYSAATDHFMVLMCDGIWNSMTNEEVISFVAKRIDTKKLSAITEEIIDTILPNEMPRGIKGKDNMTFVIIKFVHNKENTAR